MSFVVKYSIIIPYYNDLDKLKRLLLSIPTKEEIQVIVVDDNSNFNERADTIASDFSSVNFYLNYSGKKGAGASRNIGLKYAKGKWILFADADDYFLEGAFEKVDAYLNSDNDIVYFTPTSIYEDTGEVARRHINYKELIKTYELGKKEDIRYKFYVPWSKMVRRELVDKYKICFDEVIAGNDVNFSLKIGYFSKKIAVSLEEIYCVTMSKGSLTTTKSYINFISRYETAKRYNDFLKDKSLGQYQRAMLSYLIGSLNYGFFIFFSILKDIVINKYRVIPKSYFKYLKSPVLILEKVKLNERRYYERS